MIKMNSEKSLKFAGFSAAALLCISLWSSAAPVKTKTRSFIFTYSFSVKNIPQDAGEILVWAPIPDSTPYQQISRLRIKSPYPYYVSKERLYSNRILSVKIQPPMPEEIPLKLTFKVKRTEHVAAFKVSQGTSASPKAPARELRKFLKPSAKMLVNSEIKNLALKITNGKKVKLEWVRALYDFVAGFMKYDKSGTGWGNGDVKFCLAEKRGNCSDYHSLYGALAISLGIPTKFEIGFPVPETTEGEIPGYHCWAESYIEGIGWVPMDISEGDKHSERYEYFFGAHDENRVQFTTGRDLALVPKQQGEKLNYFIYPYVEVDGKPHAGVEKKFSFKEISLE